MRAAHDANTTNSLIMLTKFAVGFAHCARLSKPPPSATRPPLRKGNLDISKGFAGQSLNAYNARNVNNEATAGTITGTFDGALTGCRSYTVYPYCDSGNTAANGHRACGYLRERDRG
jgi:hypothetical protein